MPASSSASILASSVMFASMAATSTLDEAVPAVFEVTALGGSEQLQRVMVRLEVDFEGYVLGVGEWWSRGWSMVADGEECLENRG